jgi:hypothetical protein
MPAWIIQREANALLTDLLNNPMQVILIPAPEPRHAMHKVRAVVSRPPDWYMEIYRVNGGRKSFKRWRFIRALKNPFGSSRYQQLVLETINRNLAVPF